MAESSDGVDVVTVEADESLLDGHLVERSAASAIYRKRLSEFDFEKVHPADVAEWEEKGWEFAARGKKRHKVRRPKSHHRMLEDRAWCLLFRMGYQDLGAERFVIRFRRDSGTIGSKQIDAFAADNDTAIVVECKSNKERGRRSLRQDIQETRSLQDYMRKSIFSHYKSKPKIIWLYITSNVIWSEPDVDRAKDAGIYVITENELSYFETFIGHMGSAGRYQVLGEFLQGQRISNQPAPKVPAIRGKLGGQTFYSFVTTPRELLKIAFVNHQALNHPDATPAYQRMISPSRTKAIGEFIRQGGYFPTNLLINFNDSPAFSLLPNKDNGDKNLKFGWLTLPNKYRSAWIIDGQHRLYGYSGLDEKYLDQSLAVIAFEGLPKAKEADLFITINHKQKSVPKGLLVALLADLKMGDPEPRTALSALASAVVRSINSDKTGPLMQRFRMPDVPPTDRQNLTISEVVNGISRSGLLGKVVHKSIVPGALSGATDAATIDRARQVLNGYFEGIRAANPARWEAGGSAYVCVNPGIRAHLMLIPEIMSYVAHRKGVDFMTMSESEAIAELSRISEPIQQFIRAASDEEIKDKFSRRFGEGGVKDYIFELTRLIASVHPDFGSEEFRRRLEQESSDAITEANKDILKISEIMTDVVVGTLKAVHGTHLLESGDAAYWELGISKVGIKDKTHKRQQEDPLDRRKRKEAYLDVIDLKEIVEQPNNWPHFQATFGLASPGEGKGGKHTAWMARFNDIRKIAAHKNSLRTYTEDDLEFLDWVRAEACPRLEAALKMI